jgi:murein DD-endopeptidase MepM/ murein hydrolase activator NlpD
MVTLLLLIAGCARPEQPPAAEQAVDSAPSVVPSHPDSSLPAPVSGLSSDLTAALDSLLKGSSVDPDLWFSARTAHALRSATVDEGGHATVDFRDLNLLIPNASSSAGSASLLEQLNATVFRLPAIQSVEYQLNGSCHRFWTWLQYSCHTIMRDSIVTPAVAAPLTVTPAIPAPRTVTPLKPASPSALSPAAGSVATPVELAVLSAALDVPVQGVTRAQLRDTYTEQRAGHIHEALDIRAPRGTPVLSSTKGRLLKLFNSQPGGLMVYATDASERFILLYGHLDRYADGLSEGMPLERGQVIGFVGTTGNAPPDTPHLHFGILRGQPNVSWSKGTAVNPYPLLVPVK